MFVYLFDYTCSSTIKVYYHFKNSLQSSTSTFGRCRYMIQRLGKDFRMVWFSHIPFIPVLHHNNRRCYSASGRFFFSVITERRADGATCITCVTWDWVMVITIMNNPQQTVFNMVKHHDTWIFRHTARPCSYWVIVVSQGQRTSELQIAVITNSFTFIDYTVQCKRNFVNSW